MAADWLQVVRRAAGDPERERLIAEIIGESEQAKQHLRRKGYGVTGQGLLSAVREAVP